MQGRVGSYILDANSHKGKVSKYKYLGFLSSVNYLYLYVGRNSYILDAIFFLYREKSASMNILRFISNYLYFYLTCACLHLLQSFQLYCVYCKCYHVTMPYTCETCMWTCDLGVCLNHFLSWIIEECLNVFFNFKYQTQIAAQNFCTKALY